MIGDVLLIYEVFKLGDVLLMGDVLLILVIFGGEEVIRKFVLRVLNEN